MKIIKLKNMILKKKPIDESALAFDDKKVAIAQIQLDKLEKFKQDISSLFLDKELINFINKAELRIKKLIGDIKRKSGDIK